MNPLYNRYLFSGQASGHSLTAKSCSDKKQTEDFNYKEINWFNDYAPPEKEHLTHFIESLQCYLYQHVTEPTRHRKDETPSLLHLVLTSEEGMVQEIQYLPPLGESPLNRKANHQSQMRLTFVKRTMHQCEKSYRSITGKKNWFPHLRRIITYSLIYFVHTSIKILL